MNQVRLLLKKLKYIQFKKRVFLNRLFKLSSRYTFSSYRKSYQFNDFQIVFYVVAIMIPIFSFVIASFFNGATYAISNTFKFVAIPFLVVLFFHFLPIVKNRKKRRVLNRRKHKKEHLIKTCYISHVGENDILDTNYKICEKFEFPLNKYLDWKYEAIMIAVNEKYSALLNCKIEKGVAYGYYGKEKEYGVVNA